MTREEVWTAMIRLGIIKAEVHFSGGHDQGGVDEIRVIKTGDTEGTIEPYHGQDQKWENGSWLKVGPKPTGEEELAEAFAEPVYAQYDSFAGDFYVEGTVHWDLSDRSVTMVKNEEVSAWEHSEETL